MPPASGPTGTIEVHVRLLGEGVDVYRPTSAIPAGADSATLLPPRRTSTPRTRNGKFQPGTFVRIERRVLSGGEVLVASAALIRP